MLPLYYRLLTQPIATLFKCDSGEVAKRQEWIRRALFNAVVVMGVSIRRYPHDGHTWDLRSDFPNAIPPWPKCYVDLTDAVALGNIQQFGAVVQCFDKRERPDVFPDAKCWEPVDSAEIRWIVLVNLVGAWNGVPCELGELAFYFTSEAKCKGVTRNDKHFNGQFDRGGSASLPLLLTFSFANCKNVEIRESDHEGKAATTDKWHRRMKVPRVKFKTLVIDHERKQVRSDSNGTGVPGKAMHICRGHFAKYTEENPLFGCHVGTFWIPQHVRGNKEYGEVEKDYAVV